MAELSRRKFIKASGVALTGVALAKVRLRATEMEANARQRQSVNTTAIEADWETWYREIFGQQFLDALDSVETEDLHHSDALKWHFEARRALLRGERPANDWWAYFPTWSRGNMKTTLGRAMLICDAALTFSSGQGGYALIPSGTKKKGRGTAISLEHLLHTPTIKRYYDKLAIVKRNPYGFSKGWTADFIYTEANYVFHFVGLDEGMAGANVVDVRPTFIMPDDIDSREDSPVISENRFHVFTSEVLPARQENTLVYWAQNLISRYSVRYRIEKQRDRVLTNRKPTFPVPAVRGLVTTVETKNGIVQDIVKAGKCTWKVWNLQRVQDEINTYGLSAFLRECQHEVEQDKEGLVLQNYNDKVHVISKSQFASIYGTREKPQRWNGYGGNDWSRTKTKHHANVAGILTVASQNSPLPGTIFLMNPMSFSANTAPEDVAVRLLTAISPTVRHNGMVYTWKDLVKMTLQKTDLQYLIHDTSKLIEARREILAKVIPALVKPILRAQNYKGFRGSHEQNKTGALAVYQRVFGIPFIPANPGGDGGIDPLNLIMRVDYDEPHPFKQGEMGLSGFQIVVDDDTSQEPIIINGIEVYPPVPYNESLTPDDLHDADLLRYQCKNCRYRDPYLTVAGEKDGEILKMSDDFINLLMMWFYDDCLKAAQLDIDEQVEAILNVRAPELSLTAIEASEDRNIQGAMAARVNALSRIRRDVGKPKYVSAFDRANAERNRR